MNGWHNVNKNEPCPICHKTDWCNLSDDGAVCICHRVESPYLARSGSGWIHRLRDSSTFGGSQNVAARVSETGDDVFEPTKLCVSSKTTCVPKIDFARVHSAYDGDDVLLEGLALELGVEASALKALDVRLNHFDGCWSFPMRDASGKIVGLRYREFYGSKKWSARGSRDGLFYDPSLPLFACPEGTCVKTLYITEGASDTAAALSMGLKAIGRSSCTSGTRLIKDLIHHSTLNTPTSTLSLTIIADNDAPGQQGAYALADAIRIEHPRILTRVITPPAPYKDLRDFCRSRPYPLDVRRRGDRPSFSVVRVGGYNFWRRSTKGDGF